GADDGLGVVLGRNRRDDARLCALGPRRVFAAAPLLAFLALLRARLGRRRRGLLLGRIGHVRAPGSPSRGLDGRPAAPRLMREARRGPARRTQAFRGEMSIWNCVTPPSRPREIFISSNSFWK